HRRLLDMKDLDGVIVASPLHLHAKHFVDTLSAGKDLYCEKTMTWSIPEAEQCLAAAKKSDRVVQIGLQHESSGALADTRQWIREGRVGKVTSVESWMSRNTPHGKGQWVREVPSDCTAQNVNWEAFLNGRPDQRALGRNDALFPRKNQPSRRRSFDRRDERPESHGKLD